jgi:hypothetical protein
MPPPGWKIPINSCYNNELTSGTLRGSGQEKSLVTQGVAVHKSTAIARNASPGVVFQ